jgi:hypothetical protein
MRWVIAGLARYTASFETGRSREWVISKKRHVRWWVEGSKTFTVQDFDKGQHELARLAYQWRSQPDARTVVRYQRLLLSMIQQGFSEVLDVEAELPTRYMPQKYLDLHR